MLTLCPWPDPAPTLLLSSDVKSVQPVLPLLTTFSHSLCLRSSQQTWQYPFSLPSSNYSLLKLGRPWKQRAMRSWDFSLEVPEASSCDHWVPGPGWGSTELVSVLKTDSSIHRKQAGEAPDTTWIWWKSSCGSNSGEMKWRLRGPSGDPSSAPSARRHRVLTSRRGPRTDPPCACDICKFSSQVVPGLFSSWKLRNEA